MIYKKKLIEVALPLAKINFESSKEKSIRHGHPSTLHLWWARRPFCSARALIWATLVDDPSSDTKKFPTLDAQAKERHRLFQILEGISSWDSLRNRFALDAARTEIQRSTGGVLPTICDPFGGGGAIPLEALRLGLPTVTGDINPVAVLIQKSMMDIPQRFSGCSPVSRESESDFGNYSGLEGLAIDVEFFGKKVLAEVSRRVGHLYADASDPNPRNGPMAYIWARTVPSPDPTWKNPVPLVGSWILKNKPGRPVISIEPIINSESKSISFKIREGNKPDNGTISRAKGVCVATGASITNDYIKLSALEGKLSSTVVARVYDTKNGREYLSPEKGDDDRGHQSGTSVWVPEGQMPTHSQYMGCPRYGIDEWHKMFLPRQQNVISVFIDVIREIEAELYELCLNRGDTIGSPLKGGGSDALAYSQAIATYLAFILDRCVSRWNTLSIWNTIGEKIEHVFRMQAYQMTWIFAEANPFSDASGGWEGQIDWVVKVIRDLPSEIGANVAQVTASQRVLYSVPNVLITDPPYYDSVPYSDLSDFFYVFLKKTLGHIWPEECATLKTPKLEELVADHERFGSKELAKQHFERGLLEVFSNASNSADTEYPSVIYYAFRSNEEGEDGTASTGWETFLQSLLEGGLSVIRTWPIRTEMVTGLKGSKNMLASSIVLVCRKREISAPMASRGEFVAALKKELKSELKILQSENIAPVDLAQSAIGPGMAIYSRYSKVLESSGEMLSVRSALALINEILAEVLSGETSEFDAETRFAVTWYEQFGHNPGAFGDADTLAKAKNTTIAGVVESGMAISREGKLRLLERKELSDKWDPAKDSRLTVWETTQYLIRALETSELEASNLLARLGSGVGERARQLAYLLFGICDRKKWAEEGSAYNMLVTAWPQLEKLAQRNGEADGSTDSLF